MKIHLAEARSLAEQYIEKNIPPPNDDRLAIADAATVAVEDGWFFYYQSKRYLASKDHQFFIVGSAPIFVSVDGSAVEPRRGPGR